MSSLRIPADELFRLPLHARNMDDVLDDDEDLDDDELDEDDEEEEESLPPIIISEPVPSPTKAERAKPTPTKPRGETLPTSGKPYTLPAVSLLDPPVRLAVRVDEDALHTS